MVELPLFGRKDDSRPVTHVFNSKPSWDASACKQLCLKKTDCDAFTYVTKTRKCIAHMKVVSPYPDSTCSYWVKTCPGVQGEGRKYKSVNFWVCIQLNVCDNTCPSAQFSKIYAILCVICLSSVVFYGLIHTLDHK